MSADGSIVDVAISALFDLCVPLVGGGGREPTFPTNLIVPLSEEEKRDYAEAIKDCEGAWKIASNHGIVLLTMQQPYCRIVTGAGDPNSALVQFRSRLTAAGGSKKSADAIAEDFEQVHGMIAVGEDRFVSVLFSAAMGKPDAGFFGAACLVIKNG